MNNQLLLGTAVVALIVGGFFLAAVVFTLDRPAVSEDAQVTNIMETSPVAPELQPTQPTPAVSDDEYEEEYEDEYEEEDDDDVKGTTITPAPAPVPTTPKPVPAPITTAPTKIGYTLTDIAIHNTAASCWMAIRGKVYDVTKYISKHPGGNQILKRCGKDATSYFEGVSGHLKQATLNLLPGFYKGEFIS